MPRDTTSDTSETSPALSLESMSRDRMCFATGYTEKMFVLQKSFSAATFNRISDISVFSGQSVKNSLSSTSSCEW